MFAYCVCNPVRYIDSSGLACYPSMLRCEDGGEYNLPKVKVPKSRYSNFDHADLSVETEGYNLNISKEDAVLYYDTIKDGDYGKMFGINPIPYFIGLIKKYGDALSFMYDVDQASRVLWDSSTYDPEGRVLYIEEGYNILTLHRVFIGNRYSASETEYFIYNENWDLVYNDVISNTYIVD